MARANPRVLNSLLQLQRYALSVRQDAGIFPCGLAGGESTATHPHPLRT